MVIFIMQNVPTSLRGELTRWMLEPRAGVFVGTMSAMVREKLWEKISRGLRDGGAVGIHSSNTEQGFVIRTVGQTDREVEDFEGLFLVKRRIKAK